MARLGVIVRYGPAYSPCSNGINERHHASCDVTIKKMMEEKITQLNDSIVKAAAWTHITNVNKLRYTPFQLVTRKSCTHPGLTLGSVETERVSDTEALQNVMEKILKTTAELRDAEMYLN